MRNLLLIILLMSGAPLGAFSQSSPACCPEATNQKLQLLRQAIGALQQFRVAAAFLALGC